MLVSVSERSDDESKLIRVLTFGCFSNKQLRDMIAMQDEDKDEDFIDSDFDFASNKPEIELGNNLDNNVNES